MSMSTLHNQEVSFLSECLRGPLLFAVGIAPEDLHYFGGFTIEQLVCVFVLKTCWY